MMTQTADIESSARSSLIRLGYVLGTEEPFERKKAIKFAKQLIKGSEHLQSNIISFFNDDDRKCSLASEDDFARLYSIDRIIVKFPSILVNLGDEVIKIGYSCTVCQEASLSKVWVRLSFKSGSFEDYEDELGKVLDLVKDFYQSQYSEFLEKTDILDLEIKHKFHFDAQHSADPQLVDVFSSLRGGQGIEEAIKKGKEETIKGVLSFVTDENQNDLSQQALIDLWSSFSEHELRKIFTSNIEDYKGIFFTAVHPNSNMTYCKGLAFSDGIYEPQHLGLSVEEASTFSATRRLLDYFAAEL